MNNAFFERPILNSPYEYPSPHRELDETGQPTQRIEPKRHAAVAGHLRTHFASGADQVARRQRRAAVAPLRPTETLGWETSGPPPKCHINWAILDSNWEGEFDKMIDAVPAQETA